MNRGTTPSGDEQSAFLLEVFSSEDFKELAKCAGDRALRQFGARLTFFWTDGAFDRGVLQRYAAPTSTPTLTESPFVGRALQGESATRTAGQNPGEVETIIALAGPRLHSSAAVMLAGDAATIPSSGILESFLEPIRWRARELWDREHLRRSILRLEQSERVQYALYAIADLASSDLELPELLASIHKIVGALMYAENFYISLVDHERQSLRFLYFADTVDFGLNVDDSEVLFEDPSIQNSLTLALIRHGKTMRGPSARVREALNVRRDPTQGTDSEDWLGVPVTGDGKVHGAIVVQSYLPEVRYSEEDAALLGYVAQHILTALRRHQAYAELERRVEERTRALQVEIAERKRSEQLQAAYYRIAEIANRGESMDAFYRSLHEIVGGLLYAKNFFVALFDARQTLTFPYAADERDPATDFAPKKLGRGLTEYILRTGLPFRGTREQMDALFAAGVAEAQGTPSVSWLGVPLKGESRLLGVMAVQSYSQDVIYTERDQEILTFVSHHIASALERKEAQDSLKQAYADLEARLKTGERRRVRY